MLNHCDEWNSNIEKCGKITKNIIIWGAGFNLHKGENCNGSLDLEHFRMVGIRDYGYAYEWVPCPSCLLPQLSYKYDLLRKYGIVEHRSFPIQEFEFEKIDNSVDICTILNFIGSSEIIITNSYHATYWAMLMKKKVIVYRMWSSKFEGMKWKPVVYSGRLEDDIQRCIIYDNALDESRDINIQYAKKVIALIEMQN